MRGVVMTVRNVILGISSLLVGVIVAVAILFVNVNGISQRLEEKDLLLENDLTVTETATPQPEIQIQTEYKYIVVREISPFQGQVIEEINLLKGPFETSEIVSTLPVNTEMTVSTITDNYYGITTSDGVSGYVPITVITAVPTPEPTPIPEPTPESTAVPQATQAPTV